MYTGVGRGFGLGGGGGGAQPRARHVQVVLSRDLLYKLLVKPKI